MMKDQVAKIKVLWVVCGNELFAIKVNDILTCCHSTKGRSTYIKNATMWRALLESSVDFRHPLI